MTKTDEYRAALRSLDDWDEYLRRESGLPGPRGNLELAQAAADEGDRALFERLIAQNPPDRAPVSSPDEFLAFCGTVGLGRLLAEGELEHLEELHRLASDPRWRTREAVAMALQRFGDADMGGLIAAMQDWCGGPPLVQRAAAAGLCEPRLLKSSEHALAVLLILDRITESILVLPDRHGEDFLALRKGLGYCWSVAAAALPAEGKKLMEKWLLSPDKDIRWIMKENLKKNRLVRLDPEWVARWLE